MIYIHRDWGAIPEKIKKALKEAEDALNEIADPQERKKFITANAAKWSAAREYLSRMSHDKCWYSEAKESVSRYQVDHFRPHGRAKQALKDYSPGYSWLAFDLDNFRLAGGLCNSANQEYSEDTVGKADWFPLSDPSKRATLTARDCSFESPLLLDPVEPEDPCKLIFKDDGSIEPDPELHEGIKADVALAIKYLGLSQSQLNRKRRSTWLRCIRAIKRYNRIAKKRKGERTAEETEDLKELQQEIIGMSRSSSEFAATARCCLKANGLSRFVTADELLPLALSD
jgi:hypothetical protein